MISICMHSYGSQGPRTQGLQGPLAWDTWAPGSLGRGHLGFKVPGPLGPWTPGLQGPWGPGAEDTGAGSRPATPIPTKTFPQFSRFLYIKSDVFLYIYIYICFFFVFLLCFQGPLNLAHNPGIKINLEYVVSFVIVRQFPIFLKNPSCGRRYSDIVLYDGCAIKLSVQ